MAGGLVQQRPGDRRGGGHRPLPALPPGHDGRRPAGGRVGGAADHHPEVEGERRRVGDLETTVAGERVLLLAERALFRMATGELLVADPHWGKAAAFRAAGVPVPGGTTTEGLDRLARAIERTGAARLVILGDLFHARSSKQAATLDAGGAWGDR